MIRHMQTHTHTHLHDQYTPVTDITSLFISRPIWPKDYALTTGFGATIGLGPRALPSLSEYSTMTKSVAGSRRTSEHMFAYPVPAGQSCALRANTASILRTVRQACIEK